MDFVEIPMSKLSPEALQGLVEEFVSREGTDYGEHVYTFDEKVSEIMQQLENGEVLIAFDPETESCNLLRKNALDLLKQSE